MADYFFDTSALGTHYQDEPGKAVVDGLAEQLVRRLSLTSNLRTLDALQLAVALGLNKPGRPVQFVCADKALCAVAVGEGVTVIDPEVV